MWGGSGCQAGGAPERNSTPGRCAYGYGGAVKWFAQIGATDWNLYDEGRGER
jgi:hypothetical protein